MKWSFFNNTLYLKFCYPKLCALIPTAKYPKLCFVQSFNSYSEHEWFWNLQQKVEPKLTYKINDLQIQDMQTTLSHHIQEIFTLSYSNAYTLRKILNTNLVKPITINILSPHHQRVFLNAHVCSLNHNKCFTRVFPIKNSTDIIA